MQEFCVPSASFISCLTWIQLTDKDAFVSGASDGNIHLYEQGKDQPLFTFYSIMLAHEGAIEGLTWDSVHRQLASAGNSEMKLWKISIEASKFSFYLFECVIWMLHLN